MGPLVVAGVRAPDMERFATMGCRDSKKLTPDRRAHLFRSIHSDPDVVVEVRVISPARLDEAMANRSLNVIEMEQFQSIAQALAAPTVYADAADVDAERFGSQLRMALEPGSVVVAEHRADDTYPIVGAASIVAKVTRDREIAQLARRLERQLPMPMGSGYPADPITQTFLAEWVRRFGTLPEGTRTSWKTARNLLGPKQARLSGL